MAKHQTPEGTTPILVELDKVHVALLTRAAKLRGRPRVHVIREAVADHLDRIKACLR